MMEQFKDVNRRKSKPKEKAQLVGKTGEEIVDADIALQMGEKS